ncbi:hypothetical protein L218DRAFT_953139 [Marasmius fiardii PR-910]|nr:hypothetical protein L218DRAFT_953139 [Marasmius fiardii PR-910]
MVKRSPYIRAGCLDFILLAIVLGCRFIHDSTGGTKMWRSPYGDSDVRVRAIAQHVFGTIP